MLSIIDSSCPVTRGMPRRELLRIGGLALGGMAVPGLWSGLTRAAEKRGTNPVQTNKSVVFLFLQGTSVANGEGATSFGGTGHWKDITPLVFAGGGLKMGQIIGQTDRTASRATTEPYTPANLCATILHTMFDAGQVRIQPDLLPAEIAKLVLDGSPIAGLL